MLQINRRQKQSGLESWQSKTKKNPIKISCLGTKQSFSEQEIFFLQPL
jgi:hypothetical protein